MSDQTKNIPNFYCISLPNATRRRNLMWKRFSYHNLQNKLKIIDAARYDSELVRNFYGKYCHKNLVGKSWIEIKDYTLSDTDFYSKYKIDKKLKEFGCFISHIKAIRTGLENLESDNKNPYFIVCEDDILLANDFVERFSKTIKNLSEKCNLCSLGYMVWRWDKDGRTTHPWDGKNKNLNNLCKINFFHTWGTYGYLIHRDYAVEILKKFDKTFRCHNIYKKNQITSELIVQLSGGSIAFSPLIIEDAISSYIRDNDEMKHHIELMSWWGYHNYQNCENNVHTSPLRDHNFNFDKNFEVKKIPDTPKKIIFNEKELSRIMDQFTKKIYYIQTSNNQQKIINHLKKLTLFKDTCFIDSVPINSTLITDYYCKSVPNTNKNILRRIVNHFKALRKYLEDVSFNDSEGINGAIICEPNVFFRENFWKHYAQTMENLPDDVQICHFGYDIDHWTNKVGESTHVWSGKNPGASNVCKVHPELTNSGICYWIRREAAVNILSLFDQEFRSDKNGKCDRSIKKILNIFGGFISYPHIARLNYQIIENRPVTNLEAEKIELIWTKKTFLDATDTSQKVLDLLSDSSFVDVASSSQNNSSSSSSSSSSSQNNSSSSPSSSSSSQNNSSSSPSSSSQNNSSNKF